MACDVVLAEEPKLDINEQGLEFKIPKNQFYIDKIARNEIKGVTGSIPPSIISNESTFFSNLMKTFPEIVLLI